MPTHLRVQVTRAHTPQRTRSHPHVLVEDRVAHAEVCFAEIAQVAQLQVMETVQLILQTLEGHSHAHTIERS